MALIENTDFSQKNQVDLASVASLYQRKAEAEQQMKASQEQINASKQNRVLEVMGMASKLTSTLIEQKAQKQQLAAQSALMATLSTPGSKEAKIQAQIVAAAPKEAYEQIAKNAFATPEQPEFKLQNVLVDEVPAVVKVDKQGNAYDRRTNKPIMGNVQPYSQMTAPVELSPEDRVRYDRQAQAVIDGRATTTQLASLRTAGGQKLALLVAEKDPNFDFSLAPQRIALRKDYATGPTARNITSLNTVVGHLDTLNQKIDKLNNKDLKKYNTVANLVKTETGKPEVGEFKAARTAVTNELGKVFQGVGTVTEGEKKTFREDLNAAGSTEQLKNVVTTFVELVNSRLNVINENWDQSMRGVKTPIPILNEKSKRIVKKYGFDLGNSSSGAEAEAAAFFNSLGGGS
jgi:hypothetical protein